MQDELRRLETALLQLGHAAYRIAEQEPALLDRARVEDQNRFPLDIIAICDRISAEMQRTKLNVTAYRRTVIRKHLAATETN